jgi:5-formyltetrahydrofolate cyclo-ligase
MERSAENEPYLVFVPLQADYRDWPRDSFGIPEPPATLEALSESDLGRASVFVVTPGLAFDRSGGRLGRGRGYYDRFLSSARASAARRGASVFACGLCYAAQVLDELPRNEFDVPVDLIVTEEGLIGR